MLSLVKVPNAILLWVHIYNSTGSILQIAKLTSTRLGKTPNLPYVKHKELKSYTATISINKKNDLNELKVEIPELDRDLSIFYKAQHPYQIEKWEETYPENGKMMTTTATLKERIMLDYWNRNSVKDSTFRDKLKLGF